MKKMLILIHTLNGGGAEKVLVNLVKHINKEKYDITVMTIVNEGIYIKDILETKGVKYRYMFNSYFKKSRKKKRKIAIKIMNTIWSGYKWYIKHIFNEKSYQHFIKEKYDIEVAFLEGMCAKIISKSPNKKSKKVVWIHTDLTVLKKSSLAFRDPQEEKDCYKKFNKVICVSNGVKDTFIKKMGFSENIITKINPINSREIIEKSNEAVEDITRDDDFLICSVGRLIPEKGYDMLIRCHKRLLENGLKNKLWIIGEGIERANLEKYIKANKLEDTVKLIGFKNNPYKYMKMADLFVCSSKVEGLSTVLCEAIILNKPIVTTNCPGVSDIIGASENGAIITDNDEDSLYNGMYRVINDKKLYQVLLERVKERSKKFVIEKQVRDIEKTLRRL